MHASRTTAVLALLAFPLACLGRETASSGPAGIAQVGLAKETIGGVSLGASDKDAIAVFGPPIERGMAMRNGSTWLSAWTFDHGVSGFFEATQKEGPFRVRTIHIERPSALRTAAGIGIGSTLDEVKKVYGERFAHIAGTPESFWRAGTSAMGMNVRTANGKVESLILGPSE